jgi:CheY-like chemotaxis protein
MVQLERVRRLLMQPYDLAFTIASKAEIEAAFQTHFGILLSSAGREKLRLSGQGTAVAAGAGAGAVKPKPRAKPAPPGRRETGALPAGLAYEDMARALANAVAQLATQQLRHEDALLRRTQKRVRHCTLMASRLDLPPVRLDALALAAWIHSLEDKRAIARELPAGYALAEILFPDESSAAADRRIETLVLHLVECFQELQEREPNAACDISLTRRHLLTAWGSTPQQHELLETFLQILVDEDFLAELEHAAARLLIVDPAGANGREVAALIAKQGFVVEHVRSEAAAWDVIAASPPALIIAMLDRAADDDLGFCTRVKRNTATAQIGFFVVAGTDEQNRMLECLRAGADEFLTLPLSAELLTLKLQKFMQASDRRERAGLSGSLSDMSFVDMIQILSASGRTLEICVRHAHTEGIVALENGEITHAQCGDLSGEEALYRIMIWETGEFLTRPRVGPQHKTIQKPLVTLLMEGVRRADEERSRPASASG